MLNKLLLGLLVVVVVGLLSAVMYLAFLSPKQREEKKKEIAEMATRARRPPPRPVSAATPTPEPTPSVPRIARRLRVKAEEYPFRVVKSVTQPNGEMRVTLEIKNASDKDWPTAYLTLSSAFHPARPQYRLDNWRYDQVRSVDYVFPSHELRERMGELRIEDVTSVPTGEALAGVGVSVEPGIVTESGGALGLWRRTKKGLGVAPPPPEEMARLLAMDSPERARELEQGTGLQINLDGIGELDIEPIEIPETLDAEEARARRLSNEGIGKANEVIQAIRGLGDILAEKPWDEAMTPDGPGPKQMEFIQQRMNAFFANAIELQQHDEEHPSRETTAALRRLEQASDLILSYRDALERQVRTAQPDFALGR
jgi:hypothetical protein